ncbi:MAG: glycosyltransferase family 39 protein [Acidobacteria bacterium]|nr:glycosyltransferase family 39 protein [Acidobacteriota bacterium]
MSYSTAAKIEVSPSETRLLQRIKISRQNAIYLLCYSLFGLFCLLFVLPTFDDAGYWEDEIYTARDIGIGHITDTDPHFELSFSELTYVNDNHPPFYFWMIEKWTRMFGFSETASRSFSLLAYFLTAGVLLWTVREWLPEHSAAPLLVLVLFGGSNYHLTLASEARMYTLVLLWTACSLCFFLRLLRESHSALWLRNGVLLACANTLGIYTHYYFGFILAAEILVALVCVLRRRLPPRILFGLFAAPVLFIPWWNQLLVQYAQKNREGLWVRGPESTSEFLGLLARNAPEALYQLLFGISFQWPQTLALLALSAVTFLIFLRAHRKGFNATRWLLALTLTAWCLLLVNDVYHHTLTSLRTKYLFPVALPVLVLYLFLAIENLPPVRWVLLVLLLSSNGVALARGAGQANRPDWRSVAKRVQVIAEAAPVVAPDVDHRLCLRFYLPPAVQVLNEETDKLYPGEFWYVAPYFEWSDTMRQRVARLSSRFREVERIRVDRFVSLIHYTSR